MPRKYRNKTPEEQRINRIRSYGISVEEHQYLLEKQGHVCCICGGQNKSKSLDIDHDHKTGKVRGLLCGKCNTAIGLLQDNPYIVLKAYDYLNKPVTWQIEFTEADIAKRIQNLRSVRQNNENRSI